MTSKIGCPICCSGSTGLFSVVGDRLFPDRSWEVWRCSACGHGWTLPEIDVREMQSYYPPAYLGDTKRRIEEFQTARLQKTRSWLNEVEKARLVESYCPGGDILDVGCADASFLLALDAGRWRRHGVEYIREVVEVVEQLVPDVTIQAGEVYSEDLPKDRFDVVTFWHVFEHLREPVRVLKRAHELLKSGGVLFIALPRFDSAQVRLFRERWFAFDVPRHLHHYSRRSLHLVLQEAGFQVGEDRYFPRKASVHQVKHSLLKWSRDRFGSRLPYYLLKPLALVSTHLEGWTDRYSALTTIARKA